MKECCRTGDEEPRQPKQNWQKWILYAALLLAVVFVALQQVNH
ncbi:hypothetical protein POKO110462_18005 [Pontibacter korlensis]